MNKTKFIENIRKPGNKLKLTVYDTPFSTKELIIDLDEVEDVETIISDNKSVVELIEESGDLQEALKYVSDPLSKEENQALDKLKEKLTPQLLENQIKRIKDTIEFKLHEKHSKLAVSEVLLFMCENILGVKEIVIPLNLEQEMKMLKEIEIAIKKLEEIDF